MSVDAPATGLSRRQVIQVVVLAATAFIAVLDGSVVAANLGALQHDFRSGADAVVWVTVSYLLAAGVSQSLVGWASGRFGGQAVFSTGLVIFLVGSALCAVAWNLPSLIALRALQGLGGGLVEPASTALAAAIAPRHLIGRITGWFALIINVAPIAGPLLGSAAATGSWWRLVFAVNVPLAIILLIVSRRTLATPGARPPASALGSPDFLGLTLLPVGFVAVLFALNRIGSGTPGWALALIAIVGIVLLAAAVIRSRTTRLEPALDISLFRIPEFRATTIIMPLVGFTMFSLLITLTSYAQAIHGYHGTGAGIFVAALGVGLLITMPQASRLSDLVGPRILVSSGGLVLTGFLVVAAFVLPSGPVAAGLVVLVAAGMAFGTTAAPTFASIYRSLPGPKIGHGTAALFLLTQLGASAGATIAELVLDDRHANDFRLEFLVLTAVAAVLTVASRLLPGRAAPAPAS